MVRLQTLDLRIGVRVPASQPKLSRYPKEEFGFTTMRTFALSLSSLLLLSGMSGLAQDSKELTDKAPPAVEQALRGRIDQYYQAFIAGKYKQAYLLVADDSEDAFLETDKQQYKACETLRIRYSENFTKAIVVESCKSEWKWHGIVTPTTFPTTSNWKVVDGQWYWFYVKPTQVASPFSPNGVVQLPSTDPAAASAKKDAPAIPSDMKGAAAGILALVSVDRQIVHLRQDLSSKDVIHVRNGMPGVVTLKVEDPGMPGLKVTLAKAQLQAHEETTMIFEWLPDDPAKPAHNAMVALRVVQTAKILPIAVVFDGAVMPQQASPLPQK